MFSIDPGRFLIFGHRGASAHVSENTVEAFARAAEQGAEGVELDVRRTVDGFLVVHHDAWMTDRPIVQMRLADVKEANPSVPTLAEAMDACRGLIVNVELKNWSAEPDFDPEDRVAAATADWLHAAGWGSQVVISSFNPQTIDVVRAGWPDLATAQLLGHNIDPLDALTTVAARGHQGVHPNFESIADAAALVLAANELGLWVLPWTVDDAGAIQELARAGAQGVFTNDPLAARSALSN